VPAAVRGRVWPPPAGDPQGRGSPEATIEVEQQRGGVFDVAGHLERPHIDDVSAGARQQRGHDGARIGVVAADEDVAGDRRAEIRRAR